MNIIIREELSGVREEYVLICDEKVKMETAHKTVVEEVRFYITSVDNELVIVR